MIHRIPLALTVAGTDPTGGAGIQADLKSFQERTVYGMSVITSVVAQNTTGVQAVQHMPAPFIKEQLNSVFSDVRPQVVKSGMLAHPEMMQILAAFIEKYKVSYVIDPVMVAKSGDHLMDQTSKNVLRDSLVPLATVVTPNIPEAEVLLDKTIKNISDAEKAAKAIVDQLRAEAAVVTGGHFNKQPIDVLYDGETLHHFSSEYFDTNHTHGTGCTFSAVITAELAKGKPLVESVEIAKGFITDAIQYSLELGKGNGPTNHWGYRLQGVPYVEKEVF
ncbi:MAG TPA: bifunctional hydroxymethylpyrimidine kinase/phosphomethylpyrimidine kinase [Bacillota bacterium]|nr:bifunctional hydroxymethylpyrimidine kinase/phosphomethylpyrimidine kinase [Bacillota bacterium]